MSKFTASISLITKNLSILLLLNKNFGSDIIKKEDKLQNCLHEYLFNTISNMFQIINDIQGEDIIISLITALIYFDRLYHQEKINNLILIHETNDIFNEIRFIFAACFVIAEKFTRDFHFNNIEYAKAFYINTNILMKKEIYVFSVLINDHDNVFLITKNIYDNYKKILYLF